MIIIKAFKHKKWHYCMVYLLQYQLHVSEVPDRLIPILKIMAVQSDYWYITKP